MGVKREELRLARFETQKFIRSNPDMSAAALAATLGVSEGYISNCRNEDFSDLAALEIADQINDTPRPDFGEPCQEDIDVLGVLQAASTRVARHHKPDKDYKRIVIRTDKPIAIMKSADWHFGGLDVDYAALMRHIEFLWNTPNMYLQLFGDDLNLMVMHPCASARHDGWTPDEQIRWLHAFITETVQRGKLLSMGWGNHSDEFTERNAGFGVVKLIASAHVPYFRGIGYIDLVLINKKGDETVYPMAFAHKVRFNSFMNPLHGNKRMSQMHAEWFGTGRPIAREYITAHTHNPAYSTEGCLPGDRIHFIKCGTFKTDCLYSQRYFGQGRIGVPTVVYHPDRFEHVVFPTPFEAYRYMHGPDFDTTKKGK